MATSGTVAIPSAQPVKHLVSLAELSKHNTQDDCWIAVHSKVWDLTDFLGQHPGGAGILLRCAGTNATTKFDEVHVPEILEENLPMSKLRGFLQEAPKTVVTTSQPTPPTKKPEPTKEPEPDRTGPPPLYTLISAADFEKVASKALTPKTWAFYSSAATDLITHHQNKALLRRIMIQPRVLRDVRNVDYKTSILGCKSSAPFFISPAAMAKLAHPDGECALARAAAAEGIIQCISSNASYPLSSICRSVSGLNQPIFFQLYVNTERRKTEEILKKARSLGVRAIFVTVDAPVPGKREADERMAADVPLESGICGAMEKTDKKGGGIGRLMGGYFDKSLRWEDIEWIRRMSGGLPVVLKGVQCVEDARLAMRFGVDGIVLSNHGGRSLDTAQPGILNLLELRLKCPEIFSKMEVYVDGGFERATDILKAIALGATAVGIGRPFLYSLVYGQQGAEQLIQILKDEMEVTMRLSGITGLDQATPDLLNTGDVEHLIRSDNKFPPIPRRERARL